jgi:Na+/pantothenate symporter
MTKGPILFYVVLFIYLAGMAGMALYGLKQKGKAAKGQELEVINYRHEKIANDMLMCADDQVHFLANKGFGSVVIFFNVVATFLTGWVVTGIPSDAAGSGYIQFMWLLCCSCAGSTFNLLWPRWRRCAVNRNYMGPGDWYGDRYNSKCLVLLCSLAGCCFMITQQILEWMALKAIFQTITKGDIDGNLAVWLLAGFVFCCEMIGGMSYSFHVSCMCVFYTTHTFHSCLWL